MALVKFGGGIVQMAGSIAGTTFARNRYGNYARARTKPTNPNTTRQQIVRAALAFLTNRWSSTLTAPQRAAWNLYASSVLVTNRLGESTHLSGYNHYLRSNVILRKNNLTVADAGPVIFELPAQDPAFLVSGDETSQDLSFTFDVGLDWVGEDDAYMWLFQGAPQNAQRNFFSGPWQQMPGIAGNSGTPPTSPKAYSIQMSIAEGQHQWVYARIQRADGRLSEPFRHDCFITA